MSPEQEAINLIDAEWEVLVGLSAREFTSYLMDMIGDITERQCYKLYGEYFA